MGTMSKAARMELIAAIKDRYEKATRSEKGRILNEFVEVAGFHRKHAIRVLTRDSDQRGRPRSGSGKVYGEALRQALILMWETADRICGKRLKASIPILLPAMEKRGHLKLDPEVTKQLLKVSAATIDRMLAPVRKTAVTRRRRRGTRQITKEIGIKTFSDWKDPVPGFLEIDFVVHGGGSMAGEYLHSFVATDVCSGWVEAVALLAREQTLVIEGLKRIGKQLPVAIQGIDSDNDGAFINETLTGYCREMGIVFTRSRVHQKNDQAWIEQKNGAVIRRMVGHERLSGVIAGQALAQLLQVVRLYVNFFQPSFKLRERKREAGKVKRSYYPPATPCDRLLAHPSVSEATKEQLQKQRSELDPVALLQRIRQGQSALAALSKGDPSDGPQREGLDKFLAGLPELWRRGEARPTHRKPESNPHYWRTRVDPLKEGWTDILLMLQKEPDITGNSVLARLQAQHPGKVTSAVLRTLQRRIGEWRLTMARKLVLGEHEDENKVEPIRLAE